MVPINYLAVLVCGIVNTVIGFLWYGPLFGKPWMAMMNITKADMEKFKASGKSMTPMYIITFVAGLVMAFVLAHALVFASSYLNVTGVSAGLMAGFWNWLGFIAPVTLGSVLWEGHPWKLWVLNNAYWLVTLCVAGTILAAWPA